MQLRPHSQRARHPQRSHQTRSSSRYSLRSGFGSESRVLFHVKHYFPRQNLPNTSSSTSSTPMAPVSSPSRSARQVAPLQQLALALPQRSRPEQRERPLPPPARHSNWRRLDNSGDSPFQPAARQTDRRNREAHRVHLQSRRRQRPQVRQSIPLSSFVLTNVNACRLHPRLKRRLIHRRKPQNKMGCRCSLPRPCDANCLDRITSVSRIPALSMNVTGIPRTSTVISNKSRVVPAISEIIATSRRAILFISVDLPALGGPGSERQRHRE